MTLHFFFGPTDLAAIEPLSVQVSDIALSPDPDPTDAYPQGFHVRFQRSGAATPQVRPPFSGRLVFLPSDDDIRSVPEVGDVVLTASSLSSWRRIGTLLFEADADALVELDAALPDAPVVPNRLWIGPVELSTDFLLTTLGALERGTIRSGTSSYAPDHADWPKAAISEFLKGNYNPVVSLDDPTDQAGRNDNGLDWPEAAIGGSTFDLDIAVAKWGEPQDARVGAFDDIAADGVSVASPHHPANGMVPARWFLREVPWVDVDPFDLVHDAMLGPATAGPLYYPIVCTRTWQIGPNISRYFPEQSIDVTFSDAWAGPPISMVVPAHGVVFLPISGNPNPGAPIPIEVAFRPAGSAGALVDDDYTMTWLDAATPEAWKVKGTTTPLDFPLFPLTGVHILLRRRMGDEMLVERAMTGCNGLACTYLSLRRAVRSLINNRIAGGRLNNEAVTKQLTLELMYAAFGATSSLPGRVRNEWPNQQTGDPNGQALRLLPILEAFFPDPPAGHAGCANKLGTAAYNLWQTSPDAIEIGSHTSDYPDACVGRGAPGAAVALGLAEFQTALDRNAGESDGDFTTRMVDSMATGLKPGAVLQKWWSMAGYEAFRSRTSKATSQTSIGHSPLFRRYMEPAAGKPPPAMEISDQVGTHVYETEQSSDGVRRLDMSAVWISANWTE